jgi:hypothetical protein
MKSTDLLAVQEHLQKAIMMLSKHMETAPSLEYEDECFLWDARAAISNVLDQVADYNQ